MEDRNTNVNSDDIQKRLEDIARKRKELQNVEIELKAQAMARLEMMNLENRFQSKINEHIEAASLLKEQLGERQQHIQQMEMKFVEMDRELRAVKLDNEAAWAKDDLLREQNKELATFRRELDNSEAERAQRLQQMHDLQEHIQEKERQIVQLEEQNRAAQETILFKDEKLREAQSWVARLQEIDALQSTALLAQLRERTEQFNQCWIGLQRQFAEVERHHLQTIQQLQLELAEARERNGINKEGTTKSVPHNSAGSPSSVQNIVNSAETPNGNLDGLSHLTSSASGLKAGTGVGVTLASSPMIALGVGGTAAAAALHPLIIHPQPSSSSTSQIPQLVPHFQPISAHHQWQLQHLQPPQTQQNHGYDNLVNQQQQSTAIDGSGDKEILIQEPVETEKTSNANNVPQKSSFQPSLVFASPIKRSMIAVQEQMTVSDSSSSSQDQVLASTKDKPAPDESKKTKASNEKKEEKTEPDSIKQTENSVAPTQVPEPSLLDERALLGCIVRAIPPGADKRIRISTTLPNRLGKMLAPLRWHDYKRQYGKLDEFVAGHPELFVVEGDFVHLREGAHEVISATAAKAKVAAASSSSAPFRSVALTPVSQNNGNKIVNGGSSSYAAVGMGPKQQSRPAGAGVISRR